MGHLTQDPEILMLLHRGSGCRRPGAEAGNLATDHNPSVGLLKVLGQTELQANVHARHSLYHWLLWQLRLHSGCRLEGLWSGGGVRVGLLHGATFGTCSGRSRLRLRWLRLGIAGPGLLVLRLGCFADPRAPAVAHRALLPVGPVIVRAHAGPERQPQRGRAANLCDIEVGLGHQDLHLCIHRDAGVSPHLQQRHDALPHVLAPVTNMIPE
mmetsp:Transcript_35244/g.84484  ORF Transcript_35244/g.84484 Transcript_35244/m.84484 type:complete len:211 (-) Transcript_35244:1788-2420(-)